MGSNPAGDTRGKSGSATAGPFHVRSRHRGFGPEGRNALRKTVRTRHCPRAASKTGARALPSSPFLAARRASLPKPTRMGVRGSCGRGPAGGWGDERPPLCMKTRESVTMSTAAPACWKARRTGKLADLIQPETSLLAWYESGTNLFSHPPSFVRRKLESPAYQASRHPMTLLH